MSEETLAIIKVAMRANAIAMWREAAIVTANYADQMAAEGVPLDDRTCQRLAQLFRAIADGLST